MVASYVPPTGDVACNPGMCPDWESNLRPVGSQAGTQSTEPYQPGQDIYIFKVQLKIFLENNFMELMKVTKNIL